MLGGEPEKVKNGFDSLASPVYNRASGAGAGACYREYRMPGYLHLRRKTQVQPFLMSRAAGWRLAYRLAAIPRRMIIPVWRTMMKSKTMMVAVFLAMVVAAYMAGSPDNDISGAAGIAASQVSSVSGAVWEFLGSEARTGWMGLARFCSWLALIVAVVWGVIGIVCVYAEKDPFPSLIVGILETADPSLPVWTAICIPVIAPFEGVARLICGMIGIIGGAVKKLMTFNLKRLIRR